MINPNFEFILRKKILLNPLFYPFWLQKDEERLRADNCIYFLWENFIALVSKTVIIYRIP